MTQSEFIKRYCSLSGITEESLNELSTSSVICHCDQEECPGWAMVSVSNLKDHCALYVHDPTP